ncbi:MAG: hypothetical protein C4288_06335 [Leptolyngbya sp. ERB_1_1]
MDVDVQTLAKMMEEDDRWLSEHFDELIDQYPGKIVAIKDSQLVGVGDTAAEVCRPFREAGEKVMPLVVAIPFATEWDNLWI